MNYQKLVTWVGVIALLMMALGTIGSNVFQIMIYRQTTGKSASKSSEKPADKPADKAVEKPAALAPDEEPYASFDRDLPRLMELFKQGDASGIPLTSAMGIDSNDPTFATVRYMYGKVKEYEVVRTVDYRCRRCYLMKITTTDGAVTSCMLLYTSANGLCATLLEGWYLSTNKSLERVKTEMEDRVRRATRGE